MELRANTSPCGEPTERPQWEAPRLEVIGDVAEVVRRRRSARSGGSRS
jgi:hypothetical protein